MAQQARQVGRRLTGLENFVTAAKSGACGISHIPVSSLPGVRSPCSYVSAS